MVNSEQLKEFFFKAMLKGWATSGKKQTIEALPGYKVTVFSQDDLRLVDCWCVRAGSNRSYGFTTIWEKDTPVWVMHYGGQYPEAVIHVVKAALTQAYSEKQFFAGRGLPSFTLDGFEYQNQATQTGFEEFNGIEIVLDPQTKKELGWHRFFGRLLR